MQLAGKLETQQLILGHPIGLVSRVLLVLSLGAAFFALRQPLWTMSFRSNQYPDPLRMAIHSDHLEGQVTPNRDDLREINSLNHYIGMRPLAERDFSEFLWMPFAIGFLALLSLRAAAIGRLRDLVDLTVLFVYFGGFSAWRFYQQMYDYGHKLAPDAAIKVAPFMPPLYGAKRVANFDVESYPASGSYALLVFGLLVVAALVLTTRAGCLARRGGGDSTRTAAA